MRVGKSRLCNVGRVNEENVGSPNPEAVVAPADTPDRVAFGTPVPLHTVLNAGKGFGSKDDYKVKRNLPSTSFCASLSNEGASVNKQFSQDSRFLALVDVQMQVASPSAHA